MPTKQKSGLYRAKVKIGVDETGKDIYKYVSGKTKKELEAAKQKAVAYYIDGTGLADDVLFGPYAIQWYKNFKEPTIKPGTRSEYRTILNRHILPAFGDRNLRAITVMDLQRFFTSLSGMSSTVIVLAKSIFTGVFTTAVADRILDRNPVQFVKAQSRRQSPADEKRALTSDERQRIVMACKNNSDALYIALLYYLGLRRGEARGLRWGDINWHEQTVHICRSLDAHANDAPTTPKTEAGTRTVPAPPPLLAILDKYRGMPDMYILCGPNNKPLGDSRLKTIWDSIIVNLCGIKDITPHALRHNYITMCWESGVDVYATAQFVGHSSVTTTLNIYTHLSKEREKQNAQTVRKAFTK